ncbi:MAG: ISAs1 family transposase [Alphaproteobacteria bacterium]
MPSLMMILREIPDPRHGNAQRHDLLDILTIALVASVCGAESCVDFAEFAEDREPLLREFLSLENGLPSHDTFSRVFRMLDPAAFGRTFEAFLTDLGADGAGVLAIDGKTLRRSFDRAAARSPLHVVTAFGAQARLSFGQRAVAPGENEITAARALLATLTLDGALVTGDALHAQAETARLVLDRGGDWLFALKANRPAMLGEVAAFFADPPEPLETFETVDADHGRIETRRHRVTHCVDWLFGDRAEPDAPRMPGLATLACVEATRDGGPPSTRYYLSSARLTAERFARAVRSHWAIENSLHWVLDVTFDEDGARNRADNGPENLAILRRLTLNLLRTARPKLPVSRKRKRSGWSDAFARTVIGQMR